MDDTPLLQRNGPTHVEASGSYFTLQSPRVLKIGDRPSRHIIGFEEMQGMAGRCRDVVRLWSSLWRRTNVRIGPNVNLRVEALPTPFGDAEVSMPGSRTLKEGSVGIDMEDWFIAVGCDAPQISQI